MKEVLKQLENINYWHNKPEFNLGFIRKDYLRTITKLSNNKLIKVLVGQRRSGKSYIIRQSINNLISNKKINPKNIFYLNKEMFEFKNIVKAEDLSELIDKYKKLIKPKGKIYIFIDEVQNIKNWEQIISSLAQHPVSNYEIFITGSNSKLLSGELASLLSGRYVVINIYPFSYNEFLNFKKLDNNSENFLVYLQSGGLPEVYNLADNEAIRFYFRSLKDTILLKDIMYRYKIRDYILLEDIFLFLIYNIGNLTSISSIIKYFKSKGRKVDYSTVAQYLSYMQDAFLINEVPRFILKRKEVLSGEKKYYLNDIGFRNYLFPNAIKDISALLENIVLNHLKINNFDVKIGYENKLEIDFFAEKEEEKLHIQVTYLLASDETIDREFRVLKKIKDNYPKYVLSMDSILLGNVDGIIHQNIFDFIFNLNSTNTPKNI